jgi:killing trait domain-containing protein
MANTTVNAQVTDAVTQSALATIGEAASVAMGMLYQAESQAFAIGMQNAVSSQANINKIGEAVTAVACAKIMALLTG